MKKTVSLTLVILLATCFLITSYASADYFSSLNNFTKCGVAPTPMSFALSEGEQVEIYDLNINYRGNGGTCTEGTVGITGNSDNGSSFHYVFRVNDKETLYRKFKKPIIFIDPHEIDIAVVCDLSCDNLIGVGVDVVLNGKIK